MVDPARLRLREAILRTDFLAFYEKCFQTLKPGLDFQSNWHLEHIGYQLERVRAGDEHRLVINVPPRSGKSLLASVAWPMFLLGNSPAGEILALSHTESLAREFALMRRTIAEAGWYQKLYPDLKFKRLRNLDIETTAGGRIAALGVGGAILGRGADVIILDDPMQGSAAWSEVERRRFADFYDNTLFGRLNNKKTGAIIVVMQRLHEEDATAHVMANADFTQVVLPAIATEDASFTLSDVPGDFYHRVAGEVLDPAREDREVLEQIRRIQGATHFQAQYQQEPVPASGNAISRDWLRFYDEAPLGFDRIAVSWDTASTIEETSDYSVGTVWGAKGFDFYLLDVARGKFEFPDLRRRIIELHNRWEAHLTLIEDTELGRALVQDLRSAGDLYAILDDPAEGKQARLLAQSARFETGQVHLPRNAPWLGEYVSELLAFPRGRHDDQVDSTSQGLKHLTRWTNGWFPRDRPARERPSRGRPRPQGAPRR
jgi:predicted phage terminase large subunit-like protein